MTIAKILLYMFIAEPNNRVCAYIEDEIYAIKSVDTFGGCKNIGKIQLTSEWNETVTVGEFISNLNKIMTLFGNQELFLKHGKMFKVLRCYFMGDVFVIGGK